MVNGTNGTDPMVVKGLKTMFKVSNYVAGVGARAKGAGGAGDCVGGREGPTTLATFGDGSPALIRRTVGKGAAYFAAFLPGVSYFAPAIPLRPVDRSSVDEGAPLLYAAYPWSD
jgi:hypothetical protein